MSRPISRIDLHVHSYHSRTAGNWILDQIGINECYTKPIDVYNIAKSRGMDFVTLTDHDVISGALELAHKPDFFISEEISAFFPEDNAKVHIIALNINETQHNEIQRLRFNIYELVFYLQQQEVVYIMAHPFFKMGSTLTMKHIEQMLLMFNVFEVKNGGKQMTPDNLFEHIVDALSPDIIWQLADKHNMAPIGDTPWKKSTVAGSDDHGGILISSPHTKTDKASSVEELLNHIRAGNCRAEGHGGSPLAVAHSALAVGFKYLKSRKKSLDLFNNKLARLLLDNIFEETSHHGMFSVGIALVGGQAKRLVSSKRTKSSRIVQKKITRHLKSNHIRQLLKGEMRFDHPNNLYIFSVSNTIVNEYLIQTFEEFSRHQSLIKKLQCITSLKNIVPLTAPYFVAFQTENADRALMRQSAEQFLPDSFHPPRKVAIFSDDTQSRVAERDEVYDLLDDEVKLGYKPVYFTTGERDGSSGTYFEYQLLLTLKESPRYGLPPLLKVAHDFFNEACDIVFIDTLGPMGILGLLLGKLLRARIISTYHETEVNALAEASGGETSKFFKAVISLFYAQVDQVRLLDVPSTFEHEILQKSKAEVRILGDTIQFDEPEFNISPEMDLY